MSKGRNVTANPSKDVAQLDPVIVDRRHQLQGALSERTIELALEGRIWAAPEFAGLHSGTFGPTPLVGVTGTLRRLGAELIVTLSAANDGKEGLTTLRQLNDRMNEPVHLRLLDGAEVVARLGCCTVNSMKMRFDTGEILATSKLLLDDWVHTTGVPAKLWFGRLRWADFQYGNVFVRRRERGLNGQVYRLQGQLLWHLVKRRNGCDVLVEGPEDDVPTAVAMASDFQALQFVLGTPLRLVGLTGLDNAGVAVAAMGVGLGGRTQRGASLPFAPVPGITERSEFWGAVLFPLLSGALARGDEYLQVLLSAFLDSTTDNLDSAYLKLQVGIEAYCGGTQRPKKGLLVRDVASWKSWIDEHEVEVRKHAVDAATADMLLNKLRSNAPQPPSSDAVESSLAAMGIKLPEVLLEETARRNHPAHRFLMNNPGIRDLAADLARLRRLQMVAAALVAHASGYKGPLMDLTSETRWPLPIVPWWPATADSAEAQRIWGCSAQIGTGPAS